MNYPVTQPIILKTFRNLDVPCDLPGRKIVVGITMTNVIVRVVNAATVVDVNCDCGFSYSIDVPAFMTAIMNPTAFSAQYPGCNPALTADFNHDTLLDGRDIQGFVTAIVGP